MADSCYEPDFVCQTEQFVVLAAFFIILRETKLIFDQTRFWVFFLKFTSFTDTDLSSTGGFGGASVGR